MRALFKLSIIAGLFIALLPVANGADNFVAGQHYEVLEQPVRTRDKTRVEVVEVFWYGCSHCYKFEPLAAAWKKTAAADVDFWQSPAVWNNNMKTHAKMFFTAKALGVLDKVHMPIFTAMNIEGKRLANPKEIAALFAGYGVDKAKFEKTFNSFSVNSQVNQADARARSYKITGTPEIVVNGKYRVSARQAGTQAKMLEVVDFLIEKERPLLAN